jgi:hypothetical protein
MKSGLVRPYSKGISYISNGLCLERESCAFQFFHTTWLSKRNLLLVEDAEKVTLTPKYHSPQSPYFKQDHVDLLHYFMSSMRME